MLTALACQPAPNAHLENILQPLVLLRARTAWLALTAVAWVSLLAHSAN